MRCRGCQTILEFDDGAICKDCMIIAKERIRIKNNHPEQEAAMTPTKEEMLVCWECQMNNRLKPYRSCPIKKSSCIERVHAIRSLISRHGGGGPKVNKKQALEHIKEVIKVWGDAGIEIATMVELDWLRSIGVMVEEEKHG